MNLATSPELRTDRSILRPYSLVIGLSASQNETSGDLRAGLVNTIRKDAPVVGGCREKNPDNHSTLER